MKRLAIALALVAFVSGASAQSVQQSGSVTPNHVAIWKTNGVIGDAGTAASPLAGSFGVVGGQICANSAALPSAYNALCIQATSSGGVISLNNVSGGTGGLSFKINNILQGFGIVSLPVMPGNIACFANTSGNLTDCGESPSGVPLVIGTTPITGGTNPYFLYNKAGVLGNVQLATILAATYGMVCDNSTDTTTAFQAAITAAEAGGVPTEVDLPAGICRISSTINVTASNIYLRGKGATPERDGGNPAPPSSAGTALLWVGAANGTMVSFATPSAATFKNGGGGASGIAFYSDNLNGSGASAGTGLQFTSWTYSNNSDLSFYEFAAQGLYLTTVDMPNSANNDTQFNQFSRIRFYQINQAGKGIFLDGETGGPNEIGDSSLNYFWNVTGFNNGAKASGIVLGFSDNNYFYHTAIGTFGSVTTGYSIEMLGANTAFPGGNNTFDHVDYTSAIVRGTSSYTNASINNQFLQIDAGNGVPLPVVETGASAYSTTNQGLGYNWAYNQLTVGVTNAFNARASIPATTSLNIINTSQNNLQLTDGTNTWGINNNGADLRIQQLAGSGVINLGNGRPVGIFGALSYGGVTLNYGVTGTGNMVLDTSPVLTTPNLGTPSAGVATNLTGTASGLTAGNVTTNANLTGVITSVGNATSIASQTGTGTKFVVDTNPTINGLTLGGAVSGGGNQLNNVIVGASTPLAGSFTTVNASTSVTAPGYIAGSSAGITKTCTVIPTGMTIIGGIITAITGGTCS